MGHYGSQQERRNEKMRALRAVQLTTVTLANSCSDRSDSLCRIWMALPSIFSLTCFVISEQYNLNPILEQSIS